MTDEPTFHIPAKIRMLQGWLVPEGGVKNIPAIKCKLCSVSGIAYAGDAVCYVTVKRGAIEATLPACGECYELLCKVVTFEREDVGYRD